MIGPRGDCGAFMHDRQATGSRSVVFSEGRLKYEHELLEDGDVQDVVMDFLKAHLKPNAAWREWVDRHGE